MSSAKAGGYNQETEGDILHLLRTTELSCTSISKRLGVSLSYVSLLNRRFNIRAYGKNAERMGRYIDGKWRVTK